MLNQRFGPYDVIRTLGQGGMGTVYEARDSSTDEMVAVKVLPPNSADDDQLRGRFSTEIESLKKLDHPNIVGIVGYGEQDGALYFSMELVNGKSLFDELRSGRHFHWSEVVNMGIDICEGLRHAHDRGVIHRDLKPGNLLLDQDGHVKLTDFGIAKLFGGEQQTAFGGVIGTAEYMSPEQAQGQPVTIRSDMYSLGSVLYALLARRPPFESSSLPEAIKNLTEEKPPPVLDVAPNTPPELAKAIDRLLEKRPEDRIGTAQSLSNRLKSIAAEIDEEDVGFVSTPQDSVIEDDAPDPNQTDVPDTVRVKRVTSGAPKPLQPPNDPVPPSFVSTEIPPTVIQGQTSANAPASPFFPAPVSQEKFLVVDEREREDARRIPVASPTQGPIWPYATALVLLLALGAGGIAYSTSPKSADTIYAEIQTAKEEGADELSKIEDELSDFVERFPDDARVDEVREYLTFVQGSKYPRRLEQRARLREKESLSLCQRDYLAALRTAEVDPADAVRQFETILVIYGDLKAAPPDVLQCVESVRLQLDRLRPVADKYIDGHQLIIRQHLTQAGKIADTDPAAAREILDGLLERYARKPWAADYAEQARTMLKSIEAGKSSG